MQLLWLTVMSGDKHRRLSKGGNQAGTGGAKGGTRGGVRRAYINIITRRMQGQEGCAEEYVTTT